LLDIEKVKMSQSSISFAVGVKLYSVHTSTVVAAVQLIVGALLTDTTVTSITVIINGSQLAASCSQSITLIVIPS